MLFVLPAEYVIYRTNLGIVFMIRTILLLFSIGLLCTAQAQTSNNQIALAIHGGAGTIQRESMSPEREAEYRAKLEEALRAGYRVLQTGGTSLDAVTSAIQLMEESPLFNAGKGAVFTNEGKNELDAAIMDGKTRNAGTVAGITTVRSPVAAARAVMENSPHVMLIGAGARAVCSRARLRNGRPIVLFH